MQGTNVPVASFINFHLLQGIEYSATISVKLENKMGNRCHHGMLVLWFGVGDQV